MGPIDNGVVGALPREGVEASKASKAKLPPLRKNRDFVLILLGQGISAIGDGVTMTAISLYVAQTTGSGAELGLLTALRFIPEIGFGLVAGSLADRWSRRAMMIWADFGRAVLTAAIPMAVWSGMPVLPVIVGVTVPLSVLGVLFSAAYRGLITSIVRDDQIGAATSSFGALITLGLIVGPALAGLLMSSVGPATTLWIDAASFVVSAVLLLYVRSPPRARVATSTSMVKEIREGLSFAFGEPRLRPLSLLAVFDGFVSAPLIAAITIFSTSRGMPPSTVGAIFSAAGLGATVGFLLSGLISRFRPGLLAMGALAARGVLFLTLASDVSPIRLIATVGLASALNACFLTLTLSLRVSVTPDALQGRVGSTINVFSTTALALGALAGGALIDASSASATIRVVGTLYLAGALAFVGSRSLRSARLAGTPS